MKEVILLTVLFMSNGSLVVDDADSPQYSSHETCMMAGDHILNMYGNEEITVTVRGEKTSGTVVGYLCESYKFVGKSEKI